VDLVVVEKAPDLIPAMEQDRVLYLHGDAASEAVLEKPGFSGRKDWPPPWHRYGQRLLVLTARQMAPHLAIIARAGFEDSKKKLKAVGANLVEPHEMGAFRMAQRILRRRSRARVRLPAPAKTSRWRSRRERCLRAAHLSLKDSGIRQKYNLIIIAIKKPAGAMLFNPSFEAVIQPGDTVIAVGEVDNLDQLEKVLNP
jgi:voltage-gated potassium channel